MKTSVPLLLLLGLCSMAHSAKILGIFPMTSHSHFILGHELFEGLAKKGHDVTFISAYDKNTTYKNIYLDGIHEEIEKMQREKQQTENPSINEMRNISPYVMFMWMGEMMLAQNELIFKHPKVQALMKKEKFDVVVLEQFMNDALKGFCVHFNARCVAFSTIGASAMSNYVVSNPSNPSYIPNLFLSYSSDMTFFQRMHNAFFTVFVNTVNKYMHIPKQEALMRKYFPATPDIPTIIQSNVDLLFLNSHPSVNDPVPTVPQMIHVGGIHINPKQDKVPADVKKFLDDATEGVVYFSLGSNVKSKDLPEEKVQSILRALSKLKMKVLWKYEDDKLEGKPKNVMIQNWMPQQEILSHPNVKVFLTHGGLLSSMEAIYFGVPLIGVPFFGDQMANMKMHVKNGFALQIDFDDLNEASLTETFDTITKNPRFAKIAKRRSKMMRDSTMKPLDLAIFWVEYLLRNSDAQFLRTAATDMPIYKYFLLDVVAFLALVALIPPIILYKCIKCRKSCVKGEKCCKAKRNKSKKE
ncbi:PREDICTED: UDP-glucuronosyltransferase-like [Nicrophorus vespilloides]|uniref:UDP-glucuronosyltransferase n=1 Tax=Nicrophorus vespilloides TaxID=110193 RepID=A0ABM1MZ57_NICVS|nr:PREDICTED: UDP-glucuronosyltransferase-like [Nicrophorus vespilloides]